MGLTLALLLMFVADQGLATTLGRQVQSLVGQKLTSSHAIVAKINAIDNYGRNALHHAVILGDLSLVEFFLANGANTKVEDNDGLIPLRYAEQLAADQPSIELMKIVSLVLEETRGVNKGDGKGWRPLVWEIMAGNIPRIVELLDRGADVLSGRIGAGSHQNIRVGRHNAVWAAEFVGDDNIIRILAQYAPDRYLTAAIDKGYRKFAQAMIERGANINVKDGYYGRGLSPAMIAAKAGRIDDLQMLVDQGAIIDTGVLFFAIHSGNPKLVKKILEHDAELAGNLLTGLLSGKLDIPQKTTIGDAVTKIEANKGGRRIIRMIKKAFDEIKLSTVATTAIASQLKGRKEYLSAVWAAELLADSKHLEILAQHAPDWLLPVAIRKGYLPKFVQAMIERGVDFNARDGHGSDYVSEQGHGSTATMVAAELGLANELWMLIDNGAQVNVEVLVRAIYSGNPEVVKITLDHNTELDRDLVIDNMFGNIDFREIAYDNVSMLFNHLADRMNEWRLVEPKHQTSLLYILRAAVVEEHLKLTQAVLDKLEDNEVYPELLRGLAIASMTGNNDMAQLLLENSVADKEKLSNHAKLLKKLEVSNLKNPKKKDPVSEAFWLAMKQHDIETIQGLIDHGLRFENTNEKGKLLYWLGRANVELFEFLVDRKIISFDYYLSNERMRRDSILLSAVASKNLSVIDKIISLGGKTGIDIALITATFSTYSGLPKSKTELVQYEERQLAIIKSLVMAGADVNALEHTQQDITNNAVPDHYERSPLTEAIRSLQAPRVKLLLEHGATKGSIDLALMRAESIVDDSREYQQNVVDYQKNLTEIKQLLAAHGLYQ